jgi:hypothetical protein
LTGRLGGEQTLAGQQAEMDRIGAVLAALDPQMEGRADPLARALGAEIGEGQEDRIMTQFLQEAENITNFDDYFRLSEKYAGHPRILAAIEDMMNAPTSETPTSEEEYVDVTAGRTAKQRRQGGG